MMLTFAAATAAFACASPGASAGAPASQPAIDQNAAGSTVTLRLGQRLKVSLPGNPTTGFVWEVAPGTASILAQQGDPDYQPDSSALGAGGVYTFTFKAVAAGSGPLKLIYRRPFEADAAPARTFEVTVVAAD
jgi:inhibitor of cysteine peptidase